MDPNQDDQNGQNPQTPADGGMGDQAPAGDSIPGDQPVVETPGVGNMDTPPAGGPAIGPDDGAGAPMGGDSNPTSTDGGSEPTA